MLFGLLVQTLPLALLDTISVSTLAIPVWFLLTPQGLRIRNVFQYLLIVGASYLALGMLLAGSLERMRGYIDAGLAHPVGDAAMAALGFALILAGLVHGLRRERNAGDGRLTRWRERAVGKNATAGGLLSVSLLAVLFEAATMFPYLIALDTLASSGASWPVTAGVLVLYCIVMMAPALLATLVLTASQRLTRPVLVRVDAWLRTNSRENTAWLLGLAGFVLIYNSAAFEYITGLFSD